MKVRMRIHGDDEAAEFVLGSLLARLPKGAAHGTRDQTEAILEIEPLELLKAMLHQTLAEIDPQRKTSVDWRIEAGSGSQDETPRVEDAENPMRFEVELDGDSDRLARLFPLASDGWPAGLLFREGYPSDAGGHTLVVDMLPRWLVERAVSDSIRKYDPVTALNLGRVQAHYTGATAVPPAAAPAEPAEPEQAQGVEDDLDARVTVMSNDTVICDGVWGKLAQVESGYWECEHPATGLKGLGSKKQQAIDSMIALVKEGQDATG